MRAWGKNVVVGMKVTMKANPKIDGKILRIYPFQDKPNIMVKWDSGSIKTCFINQLVI